jgi:uncharacterized protein (DUF58 family)
VKAAPVRGATVTGLAGAVILIAALTFGSPPLIVPGLGLLLLALAGGLIAAGGARTARIGRRLNTTRVQEGERHAVTLRIDRPWWDLSRIALQDPLISHQPDHAWRPVGRSAERRTTILPGARGRHTLAPPLLVASDPLGIARRQRTAAVAAEEVLVLPRIEPVRWLRGRGPGGGSHAEAGRRHAADPFGAGDLDGLRPYRPGAPASRIHWATLARGAGLMERRLRPDADGWPLVVLDGRGASEPAVLDTIIRAAASLTLALAREGGARLVLPGERRAHPVARDLTAWPAQHARLALLDAVAARRAPALAGAASAGLVLYVAAQGPARLPELRRMAGAVLVLPAHAGSSGRPVLTVGGCRGYELGAQLAGAA